MARRLSDPQRRLLTRRASGERIHRRAGGIDRFWPDGTLLKRNTYWSLVYAGLIDDKQGCITPAGLEALKSEKVGTPQAE